MNMLQDDTIVVKPMKNSHRGKTSPWECSKSPFVSMTENKEIANMLKEHTDSYINKVEVAV